MAAEQKQVVIFNLGEEEYGLDIMQVFEIKRMNELLITEVPNTPDFVEGVINLRGDVIPLLDLRTRFGMERKEKDKHTRVVVVRLEEKYIGFVVDSVSEVIQFAASDIDPPPEEVMQIASVFIQGIGKQEDRLVIILNTEEIVSLTEKKPDEDREKIRSEKAREPEQAVAQKQEIGADEKETKIALEEVPPEEAEKYQEEEFVLEEEAVEMEAEEEIMETEEAAPEEIEKAESPEEENEYQEEGFVSEEEMMEIEEVDESVEMEEEKEEPAGEDTTDELEREELSKEAEEQEEEYFTVERLRDILDIAGEIEEELGQEELSDVLGDGEKKTSSEDQEEDRYTVELEIIPRGAAQVTMEPQADFYSYGEEITIKIEPEIGYTFRGWAGDAAGKEDTLLLKIDGHKKLSAELEFSLPAALQEASSGDTIVVPPGVYRGTVNFAGRNITLKSTDPHDPEIVKSTVLDGDGRSPVVKFTGGEGRDAILWGFTITNGQGEENGGGIRIINGSSPTIKGNIIENNMVEGEAGGGGIGVEEASAPSICQNIIMNNSGGDWGGGIFIADNSSGFLENNIIRKNQAKIHGGGIFCRYSHIEFIDNTLEENFSGNFGGGLSLFCDNGSVVKDNNICQNRSAFSGGGIYMEGYDNPEIHGNRILNNEAVEGEGGGIYMDSIASLPSSPVVSKNRIVGNRAKTFGGGLFVGNRCDSPMRGNIIADNICRGDGGGIYISNSSPSLTGQNRITDNTAWRGGGIFAHNASPIIQGNSVEKNSAQKGGGMFVDKESMIQESEDISWPRFSVPPHSENANTYHKNSHEEDSGEGTDVFFA